MSENERVFPLEENLRILIYLIDLYIITLARGLWVLDWMCYLKQIYFLISCSCMLNLAWYLTECVCPRDED